MTTRRMLTLSNRNEDCRVQLSRSVLAFLLAACVALTWVVPIGTAWAEEAPVQAEDVQGDGGSEGQPEGGPAQEQPEGGSGENSGPAPEQPEGGSGQEAGTAQDGDGEQSGDPAPSGEAQPEGGSGTAADGEGAADSASDTEGDATITPDLLIADKTMLSGVTALGIQPLGDADITANLPGITSISGGQKTLMEGYTAEEATVSFNVENQLTNNLGPLHFTSYSNSDKISFTAGNFLNNVGNTIPVEMKLQTGLPAGTYATGVIQGRVSNPGDYDWVFSISPGFTFVVEAVPPVPEITANPASVDFGYVDEDNLNAQKRTVTFTWQGVIGDLHDMAAADLVSATGGFRLSNATIVDYGATSENKTLSLSVDVQPPAQEDVQFGSDGATTSSGTLTLTLPEPYDAGAVWTTKEVPLTIRVRAVSSASFTCDGLEWNLTTGYQDTESIRQPVGYIVHLIENSRLLIDGQDKDKFRILESTNNNSVVFIVPPGGLLDASETITIAPAVGIEPGQYEATLSVKGNTIFATIPLTLTVTSEPPAPEELRIVARDGQADASDITLVHGDVAGLAMDILPDAPAEGDLYRYGNAIPAFTWWVENADVSKDDLTVSLVGNYMVNEMEWSPYASGDRKGGTWAWPGAPGIPFTSGAIDFDVTPQAALAGLTVHYEIEIAYNKATYGGSGVLTAQGTIHVVHDWDEGAYTAPTCEAGGYTTYTCRVDGCGDSHTGNATPALGHAWGDWIVTTPATEDAAGVETRVCAHDGSHKEARAIPKLTVYHILEDFGTWSGEGDLTARIDAPYVKFVQLTYGGGVIPASEYDKWEGSTVIRLHENHLTTYPAGTHTLYAEYSDGHSEPITLIVPESAAGGKAGGTSGSSGNATGSGSGSASGSSNADSNTSSSTASTGTTAAAGKDPGSQVKSGSSGLGNGDGIEEALIGGPAGAVDSAANAAGAATQHTVRTIAFILVGVGIAALILLAAKKRRKEEEESP